MGHYGALSNNTKNAKNVKNEKTQKLQKTGRGTMGHYGTLSKNTKNAKIVEKGTMERYHNTKKCKKREKRKTQFLQKCYFFSFFEKQRNDKRAEKLRFLRFSQIEKSYFSVGFGFFSLISILKTEKGPTAPKWRS